MMRYKHVDMLLAQYDERQAAIRARLAEFASVPPSEYFYELAYCILTPQSTAVNAGKAVEALKAGRFAERHFDAAPILFRKQHYIRFHNTKARRLDEAKTVYGELSRRLSDGMSSDALRGWLVENVRGLGWKEASHFLRNIGHRDLAILDRHILKNLKKHGVLREVPKTLTQKRYLAIERKLRRFATDIGIAMDELDLLFWSNETGEILK